MLFSWTAKMGRHFLHNCSILQNGGEILFSQCAPAVLAIYFFIGWIAPLEEKMF